MISVLAQERILGATLGSVLVGGIVFNQRRGIHSTISEQKPVHISRYQISPQNEALSDSSTMTKGKIVSWIKSEGDKLSKGESVVVVESDKADMNVETFYDGYLASIMVEEGGVAPVGSAIALLAETEAEIEQARSKAQPSSSSSETLDSYSPPAQQEALDSEREFPREDKEGRHKI